MTVKYTSITMQVGLVSVLHQHIYYTNRNEYFILLLLLYVLVYIYPFRSDFCTGASYIGEKKKCNMCILYFTNVLLMPEALLTGFVIYIYIILR